MKLTIVYKDHLYIAFSDVSEKIQTSVYSVETLKKIDVSANEAQIWTSINSFIKYSDDRKVTPKVYGSRFLECVEDSVSKKFRVSAYNFCNPKGRDWEKEFDFKLSHEATTSKWIVFYNGHGPEWQFTILSTETGEEHASFKIPPLRTRGYLAYESLLFIHSPKKILAYDMEKKTFFEQLQSPSKSFVEDFFYNGKDPILLLRDHHDTTRSLSALIHGKKTPIIKNSQTAKISALVLTILTFLIIGIASWVYFRGAMNLSIAIGISALLPASGAMASTLYHVKQK